MNTPGHRRELTDDELDARLAAADAALLADVRRRHDHAGVYRAVLAPTGREPDPDVARRHIRVGTPAAVIMLRLQAWYLGSVTQEALESADDAQHHMRRILVRDVDWSSAEEGPRVEAPIRELGCVLSGLGRTMTHLVNVGGFAETLASHLARSGPTGVDPHLDWLLAQLRARVGGLLASEAWAEVLAQPFGPLTSSIPHVDEEARRIAAVLARLPWNGADLRGPDASLSGTMREVAREIDRLSGYLRELPVDACGADLSHVATREPEFFAFVVWDDDTVWAPGMLESARVWSSPVGPDKYQVLPLGPQEPAALIAVW